MFQPFCGNRAFAVDGIKQIALGRNPGIEFGKSKPVPDSNAKNPEPHKISVLEMPDGGCIITFIVSKEELQSGEFQADLLFVHQAYAATR